MFTVLLTLPTAFFGPPKINIGNGKTATLQGNGPPVLFSAGLFGTMPPAIYSELFKKMKKNVTLVTVDGTQMISADLTKRVSNALGVEKIGFFSHSSFDLDILRSEHIHKAVLCDPIVIPSMSAMPLSSLPVRISSCQYYRFGHRFLRR